MNVSPISRAAPCAWLLSVAAAVTVHSNAQAQRVTFDIAGLGSNNGAVHCLLFSTPDGFPSEARLAMKKMAVQPEGLRAECVFADIPGGTYALSVWHDANANGRLDVSFIGIPREPVGASNNAEGRMGPPRFEAAAFKFAPPTFFQRVTVK